MMKKANLFRNMALWWGMRVVMGGFGRSCAGKWVEDVRDPSNAQSLEYGPYGAGGSGLEVSVKNSANTNLRSQKSPRTPAENAERRQLGYGSVAEAWRK